MRNISKTRRTEIKREVIKIFSNPDFAILPVPVKAIAKSFSNCRLVTYQKMADFKKMDLATFIQEAHTQDAYTDYDALTDRYLIVYNNTNPFILSSFRYRWNIAHEIGHMVLKHHINYPEFRLFRNNVLKKVYRYLEDEADLFASYLLAPYAALSIHGIQTTSDLLLLCNISKQASENQMRDYTTWYKNKFTCQYDYLIARAFIHHYRCPECGYIGNLEKDTHYCSQCGNKNIGFYYSEEESELKYHSIELNEYSKTKICPNCKNENTNIDGDYCQICGKMIINKCTNDYCPGSLGLEGDARFCPHCGRESTFLQNKILFPWDDKLSQHYNITPSSSIFSHDFIPDF